MFIKKGILTDAFFLFHHKAALFLVHRHGLTGKHFAPEDLFAQHGLHRVLENQQITVVVTEKAKLSIVDASYDPQYGARPLRRYVQHTVETMLSKKLLRGDITPGQTITVDAEDGELVMK